MKVELLQITPNAELLIEDAGRTSYLSFEKTKPGSAERFIKMILKQKPKPHESVLEHAMATFRVKGGSRAFTHQLVRHRLCSFTQQSQRYVNESEFIYVVPNSIKIDPFANRVFNDAMRYIQNTYSDLIHTFGIKREDARFLLPNAVCSEIVISANLREWRHILELRGDSHAQWEIREMAQQVYEIFKKEAPAVFWDFYYNEHTKEVKKH
jgi:thymidylate synthase (FAD)